MKFQWESIKEVFSQDEDTQKMHTLIRYLVSEKNHCEYCVGMNGGILMNMFGMSEEEIFNIVLSASQMLVVNTLFDTFDVG